MKFIYASRRQTLDDDPNYISFELQQGDVYLTILAFTEEQSPVGGETCRLAYREARDGFKLLAARPDLKNLTDYLGRIGNSLRRHYQDTHQLDQNHGTSLLAILATKERAWLAQIGNPIALRVGPNKSLSPLTLHPDESPRPYSGQETTEPYILELNKPEEYFIIAGIPQLFSILSEGDFQKSISYGNPETSVIDLQQSILSAQIREPFIAVGNFFELEISPEPVAPTPTIEDIPEELDEEEDELPSWINVFKHWWLWVLAVVLVLGLVWLFSPKEDVQIIPTDRLEKVSKKSKEWSSVPHIPIAKIIASIKFYK
jgi:hypothetical protein